MTNPDSNESFKYIKVFLRFAGMRPTKRFLNIYKFYGVIYHMNFLLLFPMGFVVNLFFVENNTEMFKNLSWCLSMVNESMKFVALFSVFHKFDRNTKVILAKMDKRLLSADENELIRSAVNLNQKLHLTYFYFCMGMFIILVAFPLMVKNQLIFPAWFPFDWKTSRGKFFVAFGYQLISSFVLAITTIATNMIPIMNVIVITAHTRALSMRVQLIGNDADKTPEENYTELVNCIEDQGNLNKYYMQITQIMSRSIFVQFVVTAFTFGITIVYLLYCNETITEKLIILGYVCGVAIEILPCCYFCDEYKNAADCLTTAIFSCNWMDQNRKFKKAVIIFMQHSQKSNVMLSAKLIPVSLNSFLKLLKFSFSLFTVSSQLDS